MRREQSNSAWPSRRMMATAAVYALLAVTDVAFGQQASNALTSRANASRAQGEQSAPLRVLEIADFQCPYCARFWREVYPRLEAEYIHTGKVQWVFVNLPLPAHPHAWPAAEAALCAGGVADRFWAMHDRLFEAQDEWGQAPNPISVFVEYAGELDIPVPAFNACLTTDAVASLILKDAMFAAGARIKGTPAFIVGEDQLVTGVQSFEKWQELLEQALEKKAAR